MSVPLQTKGGGCRGKDMYFFYTVGHMNRVKEVACRIVEQMRALPGLPGSLQRLLSDGSYCHDIGMAAELHDLSKGRWDNGLLCGSRKPTGEEWAGVIYPHPYDSASYAIEKHLNELFHTHDGRSLVGERVLRFMMGHHLRFDLKNIGHDGTSMWYQGKRLNVCSSREEFDSSCNGALVWFENSVRAGGEVIEYPGYGPVDLYMKNSPLGARILKIADAFDAMTSYRKHKRNLSAEEAAKQVIDRAGSEYCPVCVAAFLNIPIRGLEELVLKSVA